MVEAYFAEVAVEGLVYHFDAPYSYKIPPELEASAKPGCRVTVPFGNGNKKKQGLILSVKPLIEAENSGRLKFISSVLDSSPLFSSEMLELVIWLKENTFCTLFEAAKAMLPAGIGLNFVVSYMANSIPESKISKLKDDELRIFKYLKDGCRFVKREKLLKDLGLPEFSKIPDKMVRDGVLITNVDAKRKTGDLTVKNVRLAVTDEEAERMLPTLTAKQKSVFNLLTDIGSASVKEVCYFTGVTQAVVMALNKKGLVELYDSEVYRKPKFDKSTEKLPSPTLTDEQNKAYEQLLSQYRSGKGSASLLFGVTGSGKTQVFLKLIEQVVKDGKGVIVMVPEIALTPQTLGIFYSHFGETVAVFHSALSAGERIDEWKRVRNGEAKIAIGTRSAVFAPFEDLGLIVIDEEQEHTYKSEMSPRFHARDVARFRCAYNNALLLLSSATPSVETYKNALDGRYSYIKLDKRYGKAVLPDVVTVDTSNTQGAVSNELYNALEECLNNNKQAILLMNRRGFNTFASCEACKTVLTCPNCSISLTYHSANNRLMCHYCGYSVSASNVCPECGEKAVRFSGFGTQRIEDEIEKIFPNAKILRMDADTTMARYSYQEKLTAFANGEYDILLGTQMVAKGLDFPNVTLVGVISIDHQLYNDDFRSSEKAFDLLTQVIGRSGRGDYKGKAYIQTILPDNDIIELSANQDYESFYNTESIIRKSMVYPPYCDICQLTFTSEQYSWSYKSAKAFFDMVKSAVTNEYSDVKVNLLGPIQPKISKINNKYRNVITIKCKNNRRFRSMMSGVLISFMKDTKLPKTTVSVDINPLS
ncbi:MAG: primosomal protein N' [Acutalibacteraceae bacterium]